MRRTPSIAEHLQGIIARHDSNTAQQWANTFIAFRPQDDKLSYKEQLAAINHFWRVQLAQLNVDTIPERECLNDEDELSDWLRNFESFVLPTIIRHGLPILAR